jgi:hypothetical protein
MRMATWAVLGSLVINLMLGLATAGVSGAAAPVRAGELHRCTGTRPAVLKTVLRAGNAPVKTPVAAHFSYLVAARMGWSVG